MANNLPTEKKVLAISLLAEDSSIRGIERVTGVHRDTIMRLGVRVGEACAKIYDEKMRRIPSRQIEVDEIWGFIGKKKRKTKAWESGVGDVWTFIALDSSTKLIPAFRVGQRTLIHARAFLQDLASRLANRIQLSSDALALNFAYYNFCKRNIAVKSTPAQAAGIEDLEWTVAELVERCGE